MQEVPAFRFSTDDLPAQDRLPVWVEVIGRQHMRLDIEMRDPRTVWAEIDAVRLSRSEITCVRSAPGLYRRTRTLAADGNGDFTFLHVEHAGFRIVTNDSGDELVDLRERTGALVFHGAPGDFDVYDRTRVNSVRIDGDALRRAAPGLDERFCHPLLSGAAVRLVVAYSDMLRRQAPIVDPALARLTETHLIDLIAVTLRPDEEVRERAAAGAVPAARLAAMRDDVMANLSRMSLSARDVARRHGVSERYVQLLFEQSGTSFARFVTAARLSRALAMLHDPACAHLRVGDIAFAVGFADLTTFNRNFRRAYGDTPRAVRRAASGRAAAG